VGGTSMPSVFSVFTPGVVKSSAWTTTLQTAERFAFAVEQRRLGKDLERYLVAPAPDARARALTACSVLLRPTSGCWSMAKAISVKAAMLPPSGSADISRGCPPGARSLARNLGGIAPKAANPAASLCSVIFQYPKIWIGISGSHQVQRPDGRTQRPNT
jgi:hypothetical protein